MGLPTAVLLLPTMLGIAVPLMALMLVWLFRDPPRGDDSDGPDSGPGGGWGGGGDPPAPPRLPPAGPVCWPEFEREFAEHVTRLGERGADAVPRR